MRSPVGARSRRIGALVAGAAVLCAALAACGSDPAEGVVDYWTRDRMLSARPEGQAGVAHVAADTYRNARVGALFHDDKQGGHFCTASVVASPGHDLLITAAHCVHTGKGGGYVKDLVFVPDYRDGLAPAGVWTPRAIIVAPQWITSSNPDYDVAFVVLRDHHGLNIEDVLGANRLGFDRGFGAFAHIIGYPANGQEPIICYNRTVEASPTQQRIACTDYMTGTSGSPWIAGLDRRTGTGTVVGVIGGYQEGGRTADVSYSVYFGPSVRALYRRALLVG